MSKAHRFERVIFHIGPYKTGSTSIQLKLNGTKDLLLRNGILYMPDFGDADMRLGLALGKTSDSLWASEDGGWWFDSPPVSHDNLNFAIVSEASAPVRLYSSESFCEVDTDKLRKFLTGLYFNRLDIVLMIREPIGWLWSSYCQECQSSVIEWTDYVNEHLDKKKYFLSKLIKPWLDVGAHISVVPLFKGRDVWTDFCEAAHIPCLTEAATIRDANISPSLIESLYNMAAVKSVAPYLQQVEEWSGVLSPGFVGRALLDINQVARPFYEYAAEFTMEQLESCGVLSRGPSAVAHEYRKAWLSDFSEFISSSICSKEQHPRLVDALRDYSEQEFESMYVPVSGFRDMLPVDSRWAVLLRMIATAIRMRNQAHVRKDLNHSSVSEEIIETSRQQEMVSSVSSPRDSVFYQNNAISDNPLSALIAPAIFETKMFLLEKWSAQYYCQDDVRTITQRYAVDGMRHVVRLMFPADSGVVKHICLGIVDGLGVLDLHEISLLDLSGSVVWTWSGDLAMLQRRVQLVLLPGMSAETLSTVISFGSHPWFELVLPDNFFARIQPGCTLAIELTPYRLSDRLPVILEQTAQQSNAKSQSSDIRQGLTTSLEALKELVQTALTQRDRVIAEQHTRLHGLREEIIRAEAQLDLLRDVLLGGHEGDQL